MPIEKNVPKYNLADATVLIYGPPKSGKSTFCAQNPEALILDADNEGTRFLDCFRVSLNTWEDVKKVAAELKAAKEQKFKTVVLDTIDGIFTLCRQEVCKRMGVNHESEDKGFGRIYDMVRTEFLKFTAFIRSQGLGLWMVSHASTKEIKISGVKRQTTTISLSASYGATCLKMADVICYIDETDTGSRILKIQPEDSLEVGDRTKRIKTNIPFTSEAEAYTLLTTAFSGPKITEGEKK